MTFSRTRRRRRVETNIPEAEAFSFWTHAVSAAAAVVALVFMVLRADGVLETTCAAIYGGTLILLFSSSSFHHTVGTMGPKWHAVSRRMDHIAIFLLIAGTYTPVTLLVLSPGWGWSIFGVVWGLAVAGTILKLFRPHTPRKFTVALYLLMGWVAVVAVWPLSQQMAGPAQALMVFGGIVYSVGAIVYARKKPDPWPQRIGFHGLWHVFVMVAAASHVWAIWAYIL